MRIQQIYANQPFGLSFEIFPPKTERGDELLWQHLARLATYKPDFISCTYGAGGTTRGRTVEICQQIQSDLSIPATAHFTCVNSTVEDLNHWLDDAHAAGIRNIMALRGDAPAGQDEFTATSGGLRYANELVELIRSRFPDMGIGVAGYPEKHPEAPDEATDLQNLIRKVQAGADAVFTQLFYINDNFYRFQDAFEKHQLNVPLIAGIMPITEFARIKRITSLCGAIIPNDLATRLENVQDDPQAQLDIGVEFAVQQCQDLIDQGVRGIHFYVLNKSEACERILDALSLPSKT